MFQEYQVLTSSNLKGMHLPWIGNVDSIVNPIQELLTGDHPVNSIDRILTTVLFVDIVDSTGLVESLGDRHWLNLLETFHAITRKEIDRFRGNQIKNTGDGVLATFDGPARANSCACVLRVAAQGLGIELRSGLHTGEIQHMQSDVAGIAIHVASRVMSAAAPGEVWTTSTVRDLVSGSGIALRTREGLNSGELHGNGSCVVSKLHHEFPDFFHFTFVLLELRKMYAFYSLLNVLTGFVLAALMD